MRHVFLITLFCVLLLSGCSEMLTSGALHSARGDIEDMQYHSALSSLTDANFSGLTNEQEVEVIFLRGKALYGIHEIDRAKAVLGYLVENYPDSKYSPQAKALLKKWSKTKGSK